MLKIRSQCAVAILLAIAVGLAAGCASKPSQDPQTSAKIGVVDMTKAVKAHPKYPTLQGLQHEYDALASQAEAEAAASAPVSPDLASGMANAADQEFNARMTAKQNEYNDQLKAAADELNRQAAAELDSYVQELDKDYQPRIFSLQLKLKTVQLTKEEAAATEQELTALQQERAAKINENHKQLAGRVDQAMAAKQAQMHEQLNAYGAELNTSLAGKAAAGQADAAKRTDAGLGLNNPARSDKEQSMALKMQEINVLQDYIMSDIRDKAAKVAAERNFDTVFVKDVIKFIGGAVDITDAVIAEFKK